MVLMGDSHDMNTGSNSLVIGNEASNAAILQIDVQGSPQDLSAIPPIPPNEEGLPAVTHQADLASGTCTIQIDNHSVHPGGPQALTFQRNALGTPAIPIATQPQSQALPIGGLTYLTIEEMEADAMLNHNNRLTDSSLLIAVQTSITLLTVWLGNGSQSFSRNTKILRDFAVGSNVVGYISAFSSMLMCRQDRWLAARILTIIACAGAAYGFIASMGMLLPDELKLWITFAACALCLPALAAGLKG